MVRKSLQRALALGMSRAVRDGAAIGAACLEPAHGTNAGSGKRFFWHFPLLGWHAVLWGASPGWCLWGHGALVGAGLLWGAYQGYSPGARGWDGAGQAGPCLSGCLDAGLSSWMLGSPPALALCQSCSRAVGTAPLQSLGKGRASASFLLPKVGSQGFRETPGAGQGSLSFSVKFCRWGSLFWEGRD